MANVYAANRGHVAPNAAILIVELTIRRWDSVPKEPEPQVKVAGGAPIGASPCQAMLTV